ncbi:MAG: hypothetical protein ACP5N9_00360 [Candidatus Bilamarchaeum sp.]|jgi:hypothetical protein
MHEASLSKDKSYFLGYKRGREWAHNHADYIEVRQWGNHELTDFDDLVLPKDEEIYFRDINCSNELDWQHYLKGWLDAVKEARKKYSHLSL